MRAWPRLGLLRWSSGSMARAICILTGHSRAYGVVRIELNESGCLTISGEFSGLLPGKHGLHVHCFGDISNDWISTGPHYNPYNKTNGAQQENRHAGSLGNINVNEDGLAKLDVLVSHLHLTGIHSIIGRTLVIHQSEDEPGKSDKEDSTTAGNEGSAVAWGVIGICQSNISEEYLEEKM